MDHNGPNLQATHRGVYDRHLYLPRHKWEPSKANRYPLHYVGSHVRIH